MDYHVYYRDISNIAIKDKTRKAWESADGRVIVAANLFRLGINRPDGRVIIHIGALWQKRWGF